jgi:DNA-binding response OmpR family regulator
MTRVLVVEDEDQLRRILVRNLAQRGYAVREARTVEAAVAICADAPPDVVVLDINLPDASGWDVLRGLAARGLARPRIVAVSAVPPNQKRLAEFCPAAFLLKPFPIDALLRAVARAAPAERDDVRRDSAAV